MSDLSTKRIVVTGGAGFLGRSVCRLLTERGVSPERIVVPRRRDFDLTLEGVGRMAGRRPPGELTVNHPTRPTGPDQDRFVGRTRR